MKGERSEEEKGNTRWLGSASKTGSLRRVLEEEEEEEFGSEIAHDSKARARLHCM